MARGARAVEFGMEKRAVIWLSRKIKKPLLKLEARDFISNQLHDLLRECGPTEAIRQRVFEGLLNGICTKPAAGSGRRSSSSARTPTTT